MNLFKRIMELSDSIMRELRSTYIDNSDESYVSLVDRYSRSDPIHDYCSGKVSEDITSTESTIHNDSLTSIEPTVLTRSITLVPLPRENPASVKQLDIKIKAKQSFTEQVFECIEGVCAIYSGECVRSIPCHINGSDCKVSALLWFQGRLVVIMICDMVGEVQAHRDCYATWTQQIADGPTVSFASPRRIAINAILALSESYEVPVNTFTYAVVFPDSAVLKNLPDRSSESYIGTFDGLFDFLSLRAQDSLQPETSIQKLRYAIHALPCRGLYYDKSSPSKTIRSSSRSVVGSCYDPLDIPRICGRVLTDKLTKNVSGPSDKQTEIADSHTPETIDLKESDVVRKELSVPGASLPSATVARPAPYIIKPDPTIGQGKKTFLTAAERPDYSDTFDFFVRDIIDSVCMRYSAGVFHTVIFHYDQQGYVTPSVIIFDGCLVAVLACERYGLIHADHDKREYWVQCINQKVLRFPSPVKTMIDFADALHTRLGVALSNIFCFIAFPDNSALKNVPPCSEGCHIGKFRDLFGFLSMKAEFGSDLNLVKSVIGNKLKVALREGHGSISPVTRLVTPRRSSVVHHMPASDRLLPKVQPQSEHSVSTRSIAQHRIENGLCPRCGLPLVRRARHSDGHPFYGCLGFPHCHYVRNIDN